MDRGDIDIDTADRNLALNNLTHIPASIIRDGKITKHNTGVYFHAVPIDPVSELCSIAYDRAEELGCFKIDVLNVGVYSLVKNEEHLLDLMKRPLDWRVFEYPEFVEKLFHINNYGELTARLKPTSIEHLAMILSMIRPGKKHLQSKCIANGFDSIKNEIWIQSPEDGYVFKHSHAVSYAVLVYVHANLLIEEATNNQLDDYT